MRFLLCRIGLVSLQRGVKINNDKNTIAIMMIRIWIKMMMIMMMLMATFTESISQMMSQYNYKL